MTIRVDIENQAALAELVARMEAGEDVLLTRDGGRTQSTVGGRA